MDNTIQNLFEERSIIVEDADTGESKNSYYDWRIVSKSRIFVNPPVPKTNYQEQQSSDGIIDITETAADRVLYENREGEWTFLLMDVPYITQDEERFGLWNKIYSNIMNFLQGRRVNVYVMDDPDYYWTGRLQVNALNPSAHSAEIIIGYSLEPYKYEHDEQEYSLTVSTSATQECAGSPMPVSPSFTISSSDYILNPNDKLTRGEAIEMLWQASTKLGTNKTTSATTTSFIDVLSSASYYSAVVWGEARGYISGYTDTIFAPKSVISRGQFLNILYKIKSSPSASGNVPFTDVPTSMYCFKSVRWAAKQGYIVGDGKKRFYPNTPITRAQATFLIWQVAGSPSNTSSTNFVDLEDGGTIKPWYFDAVAWMNDRGWVSGYTDGTFRPANGITRAQFAQIMYKYFGGDATSFSDPPFTDIDSSASYYDAVKWAYADNGRMNIMSGTSSTTFSPSRIMLRKEAIAVLYKACQGYLTYAWYEPDDPYYQEAETGMDGYEYASDVDKSSYYFDAVCWAIIYSITELDDGLRFYPDNTCTRAMVCQFCYALFKNDPLNTAPTYNTDPFPDVHMQVLYYVNACKWAVQNNILSGSESPMNVSITNEKFGTRSANIPSGTDAVEPYLMIADGDNTVTFTGNGTVSMNYKRGSL